MKLIIEDGDGRKTVVPLAGDEISIGRDHGNAVRLGEKDVSRRHGRLFREAGRFYIEDLRSLTGIRVNGEKVFGQRPVEQGDRIRISEYDLILQPEPGEKAAVRPAEPPQDSAGPAVEVPRAVRARLLGISGTYRGTALVLDRSPLRIGSSIENEIVIHHPSISRRHLRLHLVDGEWKVMDVEARNGVRINGESRAGIALRHGDVMEIGYLRFAFADAGRQLELPREFAPMSVKTQGRRGGRMPVKTVVGLLAILLTGALLLRPPPEDGDDEGDTAALRPAQEAIQAHRDVEAQQKLEAARAAGDAKAAEAAQLAHDSSAPAVRMDALAPTAPVPAAEPRASAGAHSSARRLVSEGNRKLTAQDLPGAIALYERALVLKPARPVLATAYRGMGVAFTRQGNIEEGAHYYKLYLPLCGDPAEKARVQKLLDDYDARRR